MDCESCKNKGAAPVPYLVHEGEMARCERIIKRLIVALIIVLLVLFASNIGWLIYAANDDAPGIIETGQAVTQLVTP